MAEDSQATQAEWAVKMDLADTRATVGVAVEVWEARVQTLILQILVGGVMVLFMLLLARM